MKKGPTEATVAIHPGVTLADEIEVRSVTQRELAAAMAHPARLVSDLIRGKRTITADTAIQFERALNISARFWLELQWQYDLAVARGRQSA